VRTFPSLADYLKLAGGTMTGDIDLAANKLQFTNLSLKQFSTIMGGCYTRNGVTLLDWLTRRLIWTEYLRPSSAVSDGYIQTYEDNTQHLHLRSYNTVQRTCIDLINGRADIPRAGDIIPVGLSYDCGSALIPWFNFYTRQVSLNIFTDATRPAAASAGRVIYNSDDVGLNIDDGTNWRDTDGNIT